MPMTWTVGAGLSLRHVEKDSERKYVEAYLLLYDGSVDTLI